jgi:hypothetical protein
VYMSSYLLGASRLQIETQVMAYERCLAYFY